MEEKCKAIKLWHFKDKHQQSYWKWNIYKFTYRLLYIFQSTVKQNHQDRNNLHLNGRTPTHHFSAPEFLAAKNQMFLLQHTSAFPLSLLWFPEDWEFYYTPWLKHMVKDTYFYFLTECKQQQQKCFQCFFNWVPCTNCQQEQTQNPALFCHSAFRSLSGQQQFFAIYQGQS